MRNNSLSGTMAISEQTVRDSLDLAAQEINAAGGVLGKQLEVVAEDGASEPTVFAEKAEKLISSDCVAAVFGGWTSSSRKAMLPVFEANDALLFYPVQYEGLEQSPYIFYIGATTNQQIVPALDHLREQGHRRIFLVGSDYVFPRTANRIINAYAEAHGMEVVRIYTPNAVWSRVVAEANAEIQKLKAERAKLRESAPTTTRGGRDELRETASAAEAAFGVPWPSYW